MFNARDLKRTSRRALSRARTVAGDFLATDSAMQFTNVEGNARYAFELPHDRSVPGVSAMLRAKNEAMNVPIVLPEILELFDEVVFVDNASTDDTLQQVAQIAAEHQHGDRLRIASYPFAVSRCGDEHWATREDSVANLAYFYNWCLSQCSFDYIFKWDLDMVPIPGQAATLQKAFDKIDHAGNELWSVKCQTIYRTPDGRWFAANDEISREPRLHPNKAQVRYRKARMWEALEPDIELRAREIADHPCIYELKDTSVDEFDHWTNTTDLSPRKQVEYANFCAVRDGNIDTSTFTELGADSLPKCLLDASRLPASQSPASQSPASKPPVSLT